MLRHGLLAGGLLVSTCLLAANIPKAQPPAEKAGPGRFKMQEIDTDLKVGYAVLLVDVNGDGKKDIVVVDTTRVVWYREPDLEAAHHHRGPDQARQRLHRRLRHRRRRPARLRPRRRLEAVQHQSPAAPCNGSSAARRSTSRGRSTPSARSRRSIAFASPTSTAAASRPWSSVRSWAAAARQGKNWMDGAPVRVLAYRIPEGPDAGPLGAGGARREPARRPQLLADPARQGGKGMDILTRQLRGRQPAEREPDGKWTRHATRRRQPGQSQEQPRRQRDQAGQAQERQEVHRHHRAVARQPGRRLHRAGTSRAAVGPPRHRRQAEVGPRRLVRRPRRRRRRRTHHRRPRRPERQAGRDAAACASTRRGRRDGHEVGAPLISTTAASRWRTWPSADLDGDGRLDIVAVGRQTHNVRIYWNEEVMLDCKMAAKAGISL